MSEAAAGLPSPALRAHALAALFPRLEALRAGLERRVTPPGQWLAASGGIAALFGLDIRRSLCWQYAALVIAWFLAAFIVVRLRRPPLSVHCPSRVELRAGVPAALTVGVHSRAGRPLHGLSLEPAVDAPALPRAEFLTFFRQLAGTPPRWVATELAWVAFRQALARHRGYRPERHALPPLVAGERASLALPFTARRRGAIRIPALYLLVEDPLGLARGVHRHAGPIEVLALPEPLPTAPWRREPPSAEGREALRPARAPGEEEFRALRPYRPGDSRRHIHWRMSARRGELVVREHSGGQPEPAQVALLAVGDADAVSGAAFEAAFEAAVRVAAACLEQPRGATTAPPALLLAGPGGPVTLAARGRAELRHQLRALARCAPASLPAAGALVEALAARLPAAATAEWVLPLPLPGPLLARLGQLLRSQPGLCLLLVGDTAPGLAPAAGLRWLRPASLAGDWVRGTAPVDARPPRQDE